MKFSCTQENLNNGLSTVGHIASRGASLPILNNILLKTIPGGLELTATNLEVAITTTIRGKAEGEGMITVQGKLLTEAVSLLPDEKVDLVIDGLSLLLTCDKNHTVIKGMGAEDFPVIPQVTKGQSATVPTKDLSEAINKVVFSVNPDEGRPEISGVFLGNTNGKIAIVGTDSYRLAESILVGDKGSTPENGIIIPLRAAQEVGRISQTSGADETTIFFGDNQILWQIGDTQIVSRLVSGQYPDYLQIIPKDFNTTIVVNKDALQKAVRSASLFVRSGINDVRLKFDSNKKVVVVSSTNSQLGENATEINTQTEGEGAEVVFNYRYLLDGLAAIPTKEVKIKVVGPNQPSLFEPNNNEGYRYLIMPIRQ